MITQTLINLLKIRKGKLRWFTFGYIKRLHKSNHQPSEDKLYKLIAAEDGLSKEQLEKWLIKLTENSIVRNKPLNGSNSIIPWHPFQKDNGKYYPWWTWLF